VSCYPDYLVCYDISHVKRLQKLARALEKMMIRIQNSIFYIPQASQERLFEIVSTINEHIDEEQDDVRIYTIVESGITLGKAIELRDALTIY